MSEIPDGAVDQSEDGSDRDWHPVKEAAYDVNHLYEEVESEVAKAHIEDAVTSLKSALKAERGDDRVERR